MAAALVAAAACLTMATFGCRDRAPAVGTPRGADSSGPVGTPIGTSVAKTPAGTASTEASADGPSPADQVAEATADGSTGPRPRGEAPAGDVAGGEGRVRDGASASSRVVDLDGLREVVREGSAPLTLVALWATWCGPCLEELAFLDGVVRTGRAPGLRVLALGLDERKATGELVDRALERVSPSGPPAFEQLYVAEGAFDALVAGLSPEWRGNLPATVLYDRQARVQAMLVGKLGEARFQRDVQPRLAKASGP